jgi:O-antigen ligase
VIRLGAIATTLLALFSLILTGSRSGVVALLAVLVVTVAVAGPRWRAQALGAAALVSISAVVFFVAFAPPAIKERISEAVPGQVPVTEGRSTIWQVGWRMAKANPVRGVGLGSFQTSSIHYVLEPGNLDRTDQVIDTPLVAHNIYLQALAELGVVGLVMLLGILAFPIVCALRAARRFAEMGDSRMEVVSRAVVVALAGIYTADFFASEISSKLLWLLLALGPCLLTIASSDGRAPVEPGSSDQPAGARLRA